MIVSKYIGDTRYSICKKFNPENISAKAYYVLSTAFAENLQSLGFKLRISTYIRDKLEQTINNCRMLKKLIFTYVE